MAFKIFKQAGKDVIINIDNVVSVKRDETSGITVLYSVSQTNEVDLSFEEVKVMLGVGVKKEIRGF